MPEVAMANRLRARAATPTDVRLFITFTAAMDRARDSDVLWAAAERLHAEDPSLFRPESVIAAEEKDVRARLRASGVTQRHDADSSAWLTIARTLADGRVPVVSTAIYKGRGDAVSLMQAVSASGREGPSFPLLQGPKIGTMWIRMLAYPGGASISTLEALPVAVDTHVRKVTEYLGVTVTAGQPLERVRLTIQRKWTEDVAAYGAEGPAGVANTSAALDPALWFFAKWGCTRCEREGRQLPISPICAGCRFAT